MHVLPAFMTLSSTPACKYAQPLGTVLISPGYADVLKNCQDTSVPDIATPQHTVLPAVQADNCMSCPFAGAGGAASAAAAAAGM